MTQEEKDLLLKDLCGRLPYGVMCRYQYIQYIENGKLIDINMFGRVNIDGHIKDVCDIKPYLFPLESMTEEQKEEYCGLQQKVIYNSKEPVNSDVMEYINWCYKNHIDINNLIPKGSAIDATGKNIY